jgi:thymidylate synthase (FAD)
MVVQPETFEEGSARYEIWRDACEAAEWAYFALRKDGATPELARDVLPMSLKTELVMTANLREWRHFLALRAVGTTGKPHPQIRQVALPLLNEFADWLPEVFGDLGKKTKGGKHESD